MRDRCVAWSSNCFNILPYFFSLSFLFYGPGFTWRIPSTGVISLVALNFFSLFPMSQSWGVLGGPGELLYSQAGKGMAWTNGYHTANFGSNKGGCSDFVSPFSLHTWHLFAFKNTLAHA